MNYSELLKFVFEGIITFGATYWGVSKAIKADNERERREDERKEKNLKEIKEKLIFSLLVEIKGVQKFCWENEGALSIWSPYSFETRVIEGSTEDQIKFINESRTLKGLYDLREHVRGVHQTIEVLVNFTSADSIQLEKFQKNWQEYKDKIKSLVLFLQEQLRKEYTGEFTNDFRDVSG